MLSIQWGGYYWGGYGAKYSYEYFGCNAIFDGVPFILDPAGIFHRFYVVQWVGSKHKPDLYEYPCKITVKELNKQIYRDAFEGAVHLDDGTFGLMVGLRSYIRLDSNYRQHTTLNDTVFILAGRPTSAALDKVGLDDGARYNVILKILHDRDPAIVGHASEGNE